MMRYINSVLILVSACLMIVPAFAQEDDGSIGSAYTIYSQAEKAGDKEAMLYYAKLAYERGKDEWEFDNIQLGYLASNYGKALSLNEKYGLAIKAYQDCIDILERHLPDTIPDIANCWQGTAMAELYQQDWEDGIASLEQVIAVTGQQPGDALNDKMRADAHYMIANILVPDVSFYLPMRRDEDLAKAGQHADEALLLLIQTYGESSEEVAGTYMLLALAKRGKDPATAVQYYKKASDILLKIKGEDDEQSINALTSYEILNASLADIEAEKRKWADPSACTVTAFPDAAFLSCALYRVEPEYPDGAMMPEGQIAICVIEHAIAEDGTTTDIRVIEQTNSRFGKVCVQAVEKWRYVPPVDENGQPTVREGIRTEFKFQLLR